jgi:4-diphosphocytidyl-2-C-methyl-D-erythritol kinase
MLVSAFAKINWDLLVLGKRPDGFHELDTIMTTIDLCDKLTFEPADAFRFTSSDPSLPTDDRNLVVRAAYRLAREAKISPKVWIHLEKHIPAGGGLGGGSSDAAATLWALNDLWGLRYAKDKILPLAAELGSDVPFFLIGGWCQCLGRGEMVKPIRHKGFSEIGIVLLLPKVHVPTPRVYGNLNAQVFNVKIQKHRGLTEVSQNIKLSLESLSSGRMINKEIFRNDLRQAACKTATELSGLEEFLERVYPRRWGLSGSGAAHFVVVKNELVGQEQKRLQEALAGNFPQLHCCVVSAKFIASG